MQHTTYRAQFASLAVVLSALWISTAASSRQSETNPQQSFLQALGDQNRVSPMEHAGAHGIAGWRIGAGITSTGIPTDGRQHMASELEQDNSGGTTGDYENLTVPKLWLTKGLVYPFDVGASFARLPGSRASHAGGYLQWTVYEALAQPALALRLGRSRIFGLKTTSLETTSLGAVTSWGLMFFSGYLGFGFHQHQAKTGATIDAEDTSTDASSRLVRSWTESTTTVGLQLQVLPPFMIVAFEGAFSDQESTVFQAKLSFGI